MSGTTGAPWNLPYVSATDNPRVFPAADQAQAEAVAAGLSAAVGLVSVKTALFAGTQSSSVATGANVAVTDLTITHTLADAANRLILMAYLGAAGNASSHAGQVGIAIADDGTLIGIGNAEGSRTRVGAGGRAWGSANSTAVTMPSIHLVYTPGDAVAHTYTVRAINVVAGTETVFVNRSPSDTDAATSSRAVSVLTLMEVQV